MADKAFPSVNDLGGGKTITEANLRDLIAGLMAASGAFVVSGFLVPASSVNLTITIPLGVCYVDGYRIEADAEAITVTASNTHYVYLQYAVDGSSNLLSHGLVSNTTGITPSRAILLCQLIADVSAITSTVDRRKVGFNVLQGYNPQSITSVSVSAGSAAVTNIINVIESGYLIEFAIDKNSLTGTPAFTLSIQVDGATAFSEQILLSGNFTGDLMQRFSEVGNNGAGNQVVRIYCYYRQSLKIDVECTVTGGGTLGVRVFRAKSAA